MGVPAEEQEMVSVDDAFQLTFERESLPDLHLISADLQTHAYLLSSDPQPVA